MSEILGDNTWMMKRRRTMETDDHHLQYISCREYTRLRVVTLIKFSSVCKLWYNSIRHDPHFASSHTLMQSQSYPRLIFSFLNIPCKDKNVNHFFYLTDREGSDDEDDHDDDDDDGNDNLFFHEFTTLEGKKKRELVGYCNGLICLKENNDRRGMVMIFNPSRVTLLSIFPPSKDGDIICYGFGFDSLTQEYKVVLIFCTVEDEVEDKYECLVFTLGTNSWRETRMPPPSPHQLFCAPPHFKSAIFCSGVLVWRTSSDELANEKMLLLSFNLHDETFQVIHVPNECVSLTMTKNQQQDLVHLLEFKGSLCVVHLEELSETSATDQEDQNNSSSRSRSSSCKVHLHFLKRDKVEQVWIKETYDLLPSLSLPCFNDTTTTSTTTTATPRVRLVNFNGRVSLYWFDSKERGFQLYDLQLKHLKVVRPSLEDQDTFEDNELVDYHLNSHIENFLPLETFVPNVACKLNFDALHVILKQGQRTSGGYCVVPREPVEIYFFN